MKKMTMLKSIATVALFTVFGMGASAQAPSGNPNYVNDTQADSVVVGARMPYYVQPDATVATMVTAGLLNPSYYKWELPGGAAPLKYDGSAATPDGTLSTYYKESEISFIWTSTGSFIVKTTERSNPLSGLTNGCDGSQTTRNVEVVAVPTINYTNAGGYLGTCGSTTINVPVTLSGTGPWKVSYTVTDAASNVLTVTDQVVSDGNMPYRGSVTAIPLSINFTSAPLTGAAGVYHVAITKVTDRLTAKSLNGIVGTFNGASYNVGVLATPTTSPIQYIKNL